MKKYVKITLASAFLALSSSAIAASITINDNITISDENQLSPIRVWNGGPAGLGGEDNEVEGGMSVARGQVWDLEVLGISGSLGSRDLIYVGGYNPISNSLGGDGNKGDIFVKVGGSMPVPGPVAADGGTVTNGEISNSDAGNWTYAIRFNDTSATVYKLSSSSTLTDVRYDQLKSNPWAYYSGGTVEETGVDVVYYPVLANSDINNGALNLLGDGKASIDVSESLRTENHVGIVIDMSWLDVPDNVPVWFSFTMKCGNDSIKGGFDGGFRTPDGGMSLILLGMGLMAVSFVNRRRE
jgi:hypothetical protein